MVAIIVRGGLVTDVFSDKEEEIVVLDFDNHENGEEWDEQEATILQEVYSEGLKQVY